MNKSYILTLILSLLLPKNIFSDNNNYYSQNGVTNKQNYLKDNKYTLNDDIITNTFPGKYIRIFDDSYISKIEGDLKYMDDKSKRKLFNDNLNHNITKNVMTTGLIIALILIIYNIAKSKSCEDTKVNTILQEV